MKIAVEGCCHGELDAIYETLELLERKNNLTVDILLICGDFQSVRNKADMECMAVPAKHRKMNTFYKYYSGEKVAPVLTIFVGGNHEASNYLQELPYGGWVAPKIYYMGYAGVLQFGGIRIAGMSGIYKGKDFRKGHFERPPYTEETKRSAYHIRNLDVFRLKQIKQPIDIFLSHDWPQKIYNYGDVNELLRKKSFFQDEVDKGILGNPAAAELLHLIQPSYWFSAHLHVKFPAIVQHTADNDSKLTKFLSLDKCLPRRQFLQVLDVPNDASKPLKLELDAEWLAILKSTNHLLDLSRNFCYPEAERGNFTPSKAEMKTIEEEFGGNLAIPDNFVKTVTVYDPALSKKQNSMGEAKTEVNPQTTLICSMLDLTDPNAVFLGKDSTYNLPEDNVSFDKAGEDAEGDDGDYESEPSCVSLSGSEISFSDRSVSQFSTENGSLSSLGNPDEIFVDEGDDEAKDLNPDDVEEDDDELQEILKAKKASKEMERMSLSMKLEKCMNKSDSASVSSVNSEDDLGEDAEFAEIMAAQKKENSKSDIVEVSASSAKSKTDSENTGSKDSSLSSLDSKALEISDEDAELQEMLKAQQKVKNDSASGKKILELSLDNDDIEFQNIINAQKNCDDESETFKDIQSEFFNLRPVYQSSPVVSIDDRIEQNLSSSSPDKMGLKRVEVTKTMESPVTKRFRRRNQEMYSDNSTGDEDV